MSDPSGLLRVQRLRDSVITSTTMAYAANSLEDFRESMREFAYVRSRLDDDFDALWLLMDRTDDEDIHHACREILVEIKHVRSFITMRVTALCS